MRDVRKLTSSLAAPAVHAIPVRAPSRSHLGGSPNLPGSIAWPEWQGRRLDFLARISLAEVQQAHPIEWLPSDGALLFFYDDDEQPWGYDPQDRGSTVVLHVPDMNEPFAASVESAQGESFTHSNLRFTSIDSLPSSARPPVAALSLLGDEAERYWELLDELHGDLPKHQLGGFPATIQADDMELECQLVTHGLFVGDETGYADPRAKKLKAGADDWRLLLQLDSDSTSDFMWGDAGRLYFWVRVQDATAGRFDNVWTVLQCF